MTDSDSGKAANGTRALGTFGGSAWSGYAAAVGVSAIAVWLRLLLTPVVGDHIPFACAFLAVAVTAWFGGLGPCLVAVVLGAASTWYFVLPPANSWDLPEPYQAIGLAAFVGTGCVIAMFSARTRNALKDTDEARRLSEARLAEAELARQDAKRFVTALEESERRFRGYAEHTEDVLWITRGDRPELVYVNPAFSRIYGRLPTEVLADFSRLADYVHDDDKPRARTFWQRCGEGSLLEEYRVMRPDGSMAWIRRRGFPIPDSEGNILYRAAISEDITEEKRIQDERDRLLESERLARLDAERSNRIKDEFLATLSHELRSPLNAILGWVQVLKGTSLDREEVSQALDAIGRNSRAQARLIDDLLDMSRIVSGKLRLEVQSVDLAPILRATVQSIVPAADAKGIRIEQVLDPFVGPVKGDPSRLQQIVWNLLSNAVKFTPRDGRVQVHLERVNSHCEISVSDTGRGINAERSWPWSRARDSEAAGRASWGLGRREKSRCGLRSNVHCPLTHCHCGRTGQRFDILTGSERGTGDVAGGRARNGCRRRSGCLPRPAPNSGESSCNGRHGHVSGFRPSQDREEATRYPAERCRNAWWGRIQVRGGSPSTPGSGSAHSGCCGDRVRKTRRSHQGVEGGLQHACGQACRFHRASHCHQAPDWRAIVGP